ncbi:MAG: hypothetical protein RIS35_1062 [Pseudomonadota bacterium]
MRFLFPSQGTVRALDSVPGTLLIPLAARAYGARFFPEWDADDIHAVPQLQRCGVDVVNLDDDCLTILNVLWRTALIKRKARAFFERNPDSLGVNLGAGLSQHFQWLGNGRNRWIDADLPSVIHLRRQCDAPVLERAEQRTLDLGSPGWWDRCLAEESSAPMFLILEGVLMYFHPHQVQAILAELAEHAPPGSELLCDFISPWGVGRAGLNPSMANTQAEFRWGARDAGELVALEPRLELLEQHSVAEAYGPAGTWLEMLCRPWAGGPMYAMAHLRVR